MRNRTVAIALIVSLTSLPTVASGESLAKIAVAYDIGFLGDGGYNDAVHEALILAQTKYQIPDPYLREVPTSGTTLDRLTRLRFLAKSGYTLIIAVGSGYRDTVRRASREFPTTQFAILNERTVAPLNISNIYFDERECAYLAGYLAALRSKSRVVAIVAADSLLAQSFRDGATRARSSIQVVNLNFSGDIAALDRELGGADVVYSLWDKDASVYKLVSARATKTWYIARTPEQFFVSAGLSSTNVIAVITKDLRKPINQLVRAALADSALIDVLDESGIYGRQYSLGNGAIKVELGPAFSAKNRLRIQSELQRLKELTNQG